MALFEAPNANYPKQWKDYSFDFKLFFAYHICMMVLFMAGGALSTKRELMIAALLVAILISLSLRNRRDANWRWPGVQTKGIVSALGILVLAIFFDLAAVPLASPSDPRFLPWHMAGIGIAAFGVFSALRVVQLSQADFLKECEPTGLAGLPPEPAPETPPAVSADPRWKRTIRAIYSICFLLVWIDGVASFYYFGVAFRDGSPRPTPTHTEPLNNHGQIRYIPRLQKALIDSLQTAAFIGIPSIIVAGLTTHFLVGVKLFPNMPTLEEWRRQRLKR